MFRGQYLRLSDFKGGYCGNKPKSNLRPNEALAMNDLVLGTDSGIYTRPGHRSMNNTEFGSSTDLVLGVGYSKDYGVQAIRSGKFYTTSSTALDGSASFTDSTGVYAGISNNVGGRWSIFEMTGKVLGFGGGPSSYDAPIVWTGSGNISALGGSAPTASWGFSANNRAFAYGTSSAPAGLFWSILGDPTDWASTGSGTTNVGSSSDTEPLRAVVPLNNQALLAFKRDSIYLISLVSAPFSSRFLFSGVGTLWPDSVVVADGVAYFLTPDLRMKATDGDRIIEFPDNAQDILARASYQGDGPAYYPGTRLRGGIQGVVYDWIVWSYITSAGDSSCLGIAWDLINKCWLKITNFPFTCFTQNSSSGRVYAGSRSTGRIKSPVFGGSYVGEGAAVFVDYEGSTTSAISPIWRSGWINTASFDDFTQITRAGLSGHSQSAAGNVTLSLGVDFVSSTWLTTISLPTSGSGSTEIKPSIPTGIRGNAVQFSLAFSPTASTGYINVDAVILGGKSIVAKAAA